MQVAPLSQGSTCRGQAAVPALGKIHPFVLKGDLGNAEGVHDSNPEVFISLGATLDLTGDKEGSVPLPPFGTWSKMPKSCHKLEPALGPDALS